MKRREFLQKSGFLTMSVAALGLSACSDGGSELVDGHKFPQSVASADPREDSIILWTRAVPVADDDIQTSATGDTNIRLMVSAADNAAGLGTNNALNGALVADVSLVAQSRYDHTVRHKLTGLQPNTTYFYQFSVGASRSRIGRFKTAPAATATPAQLRFAMLVCQDWTINHWAGFTDLVASEPDLDFFIHLGDYIYETVGKDFQTGAVEALHSQLKFPVGTANADGSSYATAIDDYRYLYKRYRSDARLQAVHERYAMIAVWDDHEFSDDCWGDAETYTNGTYNVATGAADNNHQTARRRSANQAWFEHMPADVTFNDAAAGFQTVQIYRDFRFGTLAQLVMTDQRLYRSDHIVSEAIPNPLTGQPIGSIGSRYMVPESLIYNRIEAAKVAAGTAAGDPLALVSMLGRTQRDWWKGKMAGTATWKLWGSEVMLLKQGLDGTAAIATLIALQGSGGAEPAFSAIRADIIANGANSAYIPASKKAALAPYFDKYVLNADDWDGFDAERRDLMAYLKTNGIKNVVALTGDIHAFYAGEVRDDYRAAGGGQAVMTEIVTAGVSSDSFYSYLKSAVTSLSADLATLVFYPIRGVPVTGLGTIDFDVNLLDFTLAKAPPTLDGLKAQARHPLRAALGAKGVPEAQLDATTDAVLAAMGQDPAFNTQLLGLARALASLNSNPWLKHVDTDAQGYGIVTVTPAAVKVELRKMNRLVAGKAPAAPIVAKRVTATVTAGSPGVQIS